MHVMGERKYTGGDTASVGVLRLSRPYVTRLTESILILLQSEVFRRGPVTSNHSVE